MLKLDASHRLNRRYILVSGGKSAIENALLEYLGILGWSRAAPTFEVRGKEVIIAVNRKEVDHAIAGLAIASDDLNVLAVSGTLKGLSKKLSKLTSTNLK